MALSVAEVYEMFDYIESNMNNNSIMKGGGSSDTEPYNTFRYGLNSIYDYFSVIFVNKNENNEKYQMSVNNLDKSCDCSKFVCKKDPELEDDDEDDTIDESELIEKIDMKDNESENSKEISQSKLLLKVSKII